MKLFAKGKGGPGAPSAPAAAFQPIDRNSLLGLLDQVVNSGQSCVLELHEPRGSWVYAFQGGALTHASGGRVRGARQAFDLLWEFQQGEYRYVPGADHGLASNLYIDKARLLDLLRRSLAALAGPASPYIPAAQQRQLPQYPAGGPGAPAWAPAQPPGAPGPGNGAPGWAPRAYPQAPGAYPPAALPQGMPPAAPPGFPQPFPPQAYPPAGQPVAAPQPTAPGGQFAPPAAPYPQPPQPLAQPPARPLTPPSFSVPPMPIPRKAQAAPAPPPPIAPPAPMPVAPATPVEAPRSAPVDDLKALRASLVAQAAAGSPPAAPAWKVRTAEGAVAPAPAEVKGSKRGAEAGKPGKAGKKQSRLSRAVELRLIKFLLWACERSYSADDHWTLKDAFEVSTMELRDQFVGAFSQSFKPAPRPGIGDEEIDELAAGRMRGRAKSRKR
jgi:hypothetical protein